MGSVLLEHLAVIAQELGISEFVAEVLLQNRKMLSVFTDAGYEVDRRIEDGIVSVRFEIKPTERSEAVRLSREHRAESVSMRAVLFPESIAVVGASRRSDSIGHQILENILAAGFTGAVYAVNNEAMEVCGLTPTPGSPTSPGTSTSPWWPCRRRRCSTSSLTAPRRG